MTAAQATLVIEQLARIHAPFWGKTDLAGTYHWLAAPVHRVEDRLGTALAVPLMMLWLQLDPEIRRAHEIKLLSVYIQGLRNNGITGICTELLQRYRAHLIYPFEAMVVSLAVGGMIKLESNRELIRRTVAAIDDLAVFSAIPIRCSGAGKSSQIYTHRAARAIGEILRPPW
mgnify:CR=1 FL=1